jgi:hypothetical protein
MKMAVHGTRRRLMKLQYMVTWIVSDTLMKMDAHGVNTLLLELRSMVTWIVSNIFTKNVVMLRHGKVLV